MYQSNVKEFSGLLNWFKALNVMYKLSVPWQVNISSVLVKLFVTCSMAVNKPSGKP